MRTFSEKCVIGHERHAAHIGVLVRSILCHPHISSGHTYDTAILIIENLGTGKASVNLDSQFLGLGRQPTSEIAEA